MNHEPFKAFLQNPKNLSKHRVNLFRDSDSTLKIKSHCESFPFSSVF